MGELRRCSETNRFFRHEPVLPDETDDDPFRIIDEMRAAFADVPPDEIERETDRILAEARGQSQTERR